MKNDFDSNAILQMMNSQQHKWNNIGLESSLSFAMKKNYEITTAISGLSSFLDMQDILSRSIGNIANANTFTRFFLNQSKNSQLSVVTIALKGLGSALAAQSFNSSMLLPKMIDRQHDMLSRLGSVNRAIFNPIWNSQINSMQRMMSGLSSHLVVSGLSGMLSDDDYENIEETTAEVTDIAMAAINENIVTIETLARIETLLTSIKNDPRTSVSFYLSIISIMLTIFPMIWTKINESETLINPAIVQQLHEIRAQLIVSHKQQSTQASITRKATVSCGLYLTPSTRSGKFEKINKGTIVTVQNVNKKWILITYINAEGLPVNGWALKKYFKNLNYTK